MAFIRTFKQKGGKVYRALMRSKWNPLTKRSEQHVVKWLGRTGESEVENFDLSMSCRSTEEKFLFDALSDRRSLLVHGQWGVGKSFLAQRVYRLLTEAGHSAHYFRWTTPQGEFIKQICEALDLPTTRTSEDGEKEVRIPQAQLLNDIGGALIEDRHILIIDKAHSIPVQIRNNIEVWLEGGATIMLVGTLPPKKELYLKFPRWELKPLDSQQSLKLVQAAAKHFQVKLTHQKARELATQGNGNPQFLIRAVSETDIKLETDPDQQEWLDLTPLVLCGLAALMVLRFIGQGLSDRNLVVMGGIFMVIGRISTIVTMRVSKQRSKIGQ